MKIGQIVKESKIFETIYVDGQLSDEKIDEFLCFGCFGFFENEPAVRCTVRSPILSATSYLCRDCHEKLIEKNPESKGRSITVHNFNTGSLRDKNER